MPPSTERAIEKLARKNMDYTIFREPDGTNDGPKTGGRERSSLEHFYYSCKSLLTGFDILFV